MKVYRIITNEEEKKNILKGFFSKKSTDINCKIFKHFAHFNIDDDIFAKGEGDYPNTFFFLDISDCVRYNEAYLNNDKNYLILELNVPSKIVYNFLTAARYKNYNKQQSQLDITLEAFIPSKIIAQKVKEKKFKLYKPEDINKKHIGSKKMNKLELLYDKAYTWQTPIDSIKKDEFRKEKEKLFFKIYTREDEKLTNF